MPSTVVHLALAGLIAAALLREFVGLRSLAVVALVIVPDLDAVAGLLIDGGHRAVLHSLVFPLGLAGLIYYDTRVRTDSWLAGQFEGNGPRVAWVGVVAIVFAGIGP